MQRRKEDEEGGKKRRFSRFSPKINKELLIIINYIFTEGILTFSLYEHQGWQTNFVHGHQNERLEVIKSSISSMR